MSKYKTIWENYKTYIEDTQTEHQNKVHDKSPLEYIGAMQQIDNDPKEHIVALRTGRIFNISEIIGIWKNNETEYFVILKNSNPIKLRFHSEQFRPSSSSESYEKDWEDFQKLIERIEQYIKST